MKRTRLCLITLFAAGVAACANVANVANTANEGAHSELGETPPIFIANEVASSRAMSEDSAADFRFLIVGDRTGGHRPGVFNRAMDQVNQLRPEFVMGVGDLIEGYSENAEQLDAEWAELESMIAKLKAPFFYVPGNHDISNNVMNELWNERRGPSFYHFMYRDVLFMVLNTENPPQPMSEEMLDGMAQYKKLFKKDPALAQKMIDDYIAEKNKAEEAAGTGKGAGENFLDVNISDEQRDSMTHALDAHKEARWTFVFMHKPAWQYESAQFRAIEQALQGRPYTMVAGHNHYYKHEQRFGRDYVVMGQTGGSQHQGGPGNIDHISYVSMTKEGPVFATVKLDGLSDIKGPAE